MPVTMKELGIDKLSPEDRLMLFQELVHSLDADHRAGLVTDVQCMEMNRLCAEQKANPDPALTWAQIRSRIVGAQ